jgi:hypothetical protein
MKVMIFFWDGFFFGSTGKTVLAARRLEMCRFTNAGVGAGISGDPEVSV